MMKTPVLAAALAVSAAMASAESATYNIDPSHTFVTFEQTHFGTSTNRGRFSKNSGTVEFDRIAKRGRVQLTLDMPAINTGVTPFDRHLQGPDFFDTAKYPTARFVSDRFVFNGDNVAEVAGQLTMKGKTLPVTLKAMRFNCYDHPMLKREVCGGDFEATLRRSQWGVDWGLEMGVADATKLIVQVEAIRQ